MKYILGCFLIRIEGVLTLEYWRFSEYKLMLKLRCFIKKLVFWHECIFSSKLISGIKTVLWIKRFQISRETNEIKCVNLYAWVRLTQCQVHWGQLLIKVCLMWDSSSVYSDERVTERIRNFLSAVWSQTCSFYILSKYLAIISVYFSCSCSARKHILEWQSMEKDAFMPQNGVVMASISRG